MKNGTAISAKRSMPQNRYLGSAISGSCPVAEDRSERRASEREGDGDAERQQRDADDEETPTIVAMR